MQTSMIVDFDVMVVVSEFSLKTGVSKNFIMKKLLNKVDIEFCYTPILATLIKYQRHHPENGYVQFQYKLTPEEKVKFEGMRDKYKASIGLLVLVGFLLYFKKLARKYLKDKNKQVFDKIVNTYIPLSCNIIKNMMGYWMVQGKEP